MYLTCYDLSSIDDYQNNGVRFVYRDHGNKWSNDVEPEYVAMDESGDKAYVCLQVSVI